MADYDVAVVGRGFAADLAAASAAGSGAHVVLARTRAGPRAPPARGVLGDVRLLDGLGPSSDPCPIGRRLAEHRFAVLTPGASLALEFRDGAHAGNLPVTLDPATCEPWLDRVTRSRGVAEEGDGRVDGLWQEGGRVAGIVLAGERVAARLTVVADGARGFLLPGRAGEDVSREAALEALHALPAASLRRRWGLAGDLGSSLTAVLGFLPEDELGVGYLYTLAEGVVVGVRVRSISGDRAPDANRALRAFAAHPTIAPLLQGSESPGAEPIEPPGTGVGGPLYGDGFLVAGGPAGLGYSNVLTTRSLDAAIRSGLIAGGLAGELARSGGAPSARAGLYPRRLREAGVTREARRGRATAARFGWNPRLHHRYPPFLIDLFHRLMTESGGPKRSVRSTVLAARREARIGWATLAADAALGGSSL